MDQIMEKIREIEKRLFAYNYALALIGIDDATAAPTPFPVTPSRKLSPQLICFFIRSMPVLPLSFSLSS